MATIWWMSTSGNNNVSMLLNKGGGSFAAAVNYNVGSESGDGLAFADLNGDGKLDIAVANYWQRHGEHSPRQRRRHVQGTAVNGNFTVGSSPYAVVAANLGTQTTSLTWPWPTTAAAT